MLGSGQVVEVVGEPTGVGFQRAPSDQPAGDTDLANELELIHWVAILREVSSNVRVGSVKRRMRSACTSFDVSFALRRVTSCSACMRNVLGTVRWYFSGTRRLVRSA